MKVNLVYYVTRTIIVILITLCSFIVPNINIMLVLGGSILGTIVTVIIPVLFYNRAYSDSFKNLEKERCSSTPEIKKLETPRLIDFPFNEQDPLL